MNFGHKVAVGYSLFVILIVSMVVFCFQQDFYLEAENYYEKEVNFGDEILAVNNFNLLASDLKVKNNAQLEIHLPDTLMGNEIAYSVLFKKPNNANLDKSFVITSSNGVVGMDYENFVDGLYNLEMTFVLNGKQYLRKKGIMVNRR